MTKMITREFHCSFIWDIVMYEEGYGNPPLPENVKIVRDTSVNRGEVWTDSTIIFELIDEFKFYTVDTKYNARREALDIQDIASGEWHSNGFVECAEVVPHVEQVVVYDYVEDNKMETKMVSPIISRQTYMGVIVSEYPVESGNRFWLDGCQCTNMNAENLQEWARRYDADEILVEFDEDKCRIVDERVANTWLHEDVVYA